MITNIKPVSWTILITKQWLITILFHETKWGVLHKKPYHKTISRTGIKGGLYGKVLARKSPNYGTLRYIIVELTHPEVEIPPRIFLTTLKTPCPNMSWVGPILLVCSTCTVTGHGVTNVRPVPGWWLPWVLYVGNMPTQAMDFRV